MRSLAVLSLALLVGTMSQTYAAEDGDVLTIEVDVFSGRPNPKIELTGDEAKNLSKRLQGSCLTAQGRSDLPGYPERLGYRGIRIKRKIAGKSALTSVISSGVLKFVKDGAYAMCAVSVSAGQELASNDSNSVFEKDLVRMAFQKGAINKSLHDTIVETIDASANK